MIRITKRCPYFGDRAQIISSPGKKNGKYKVQVAGSPGTFELERKDFVVLSSAKMGARY
jgi:hypothetical protein